MSKSGLRIKKSRSMMFSLYSLSGFAALLVIAFIGTLWARTVPLLGGADWVSLSKILVNTFCIQALAVAIAIPVAISMTFLSVLWRSTRRASYLEFCLSIIQKVPILIFGVIFLTFLGGNYWSLVLTFALVATSELNRRWIQVAEKVKIIEIESMRSLGMGAFQIIIILYVRRYFRLFVSHLASVFCNLFVLVTPILCFVGFNDSGDGLVAAQLLVTVLQESDRAIDFAFVILIVHLIRVFIDQKTSFWEADYG